MKHPVGCLGLNFYFFDFVFHSAFCADARAVAVDVLELLENGVFLRHFVHENGGFSAVEIAFERAKPHSKARAAHFNVAFADCPKAAESLYWVRGEHNGALLHCGKESARHVHHIVRLIEAFYVKPAFHVGNGAGDDSAAVGNIEKFIFFAFEVRLAELACFDFGFFYAENSFQRVVAHYFRGEKLRF